MKDALNRKHQIILADEAIKGELYFCPDCKTPVILRSGEKSEPYFAHPAYTGETLRDICPRFSKQSNKNSSISATYATGQKVARSKYISTALRDGKLSPEEAEDMFMLVHSSYAEKVIVLENRAQEIDTKEQDLRDQEQELWDNLASATQEVANPAAYTLSSLYRREMLIHSWLHNSHYQRCIPYGANEIPLFYSSEMIVDLWLHLRGANPFDIEYKGVNNRPIYKGREVYLLSNDPTLKLILEHIIGNTDHHWKDVAEEHMEMFLSFGGTELHDYGDRDFI